MSHRAVLPREQSSWGQHGAHLGPVGPRWAPCWSHEPCCQGVLAVLYRAMLSTEVNNVYEIIHDLLCNHHCAHWRHNSLYHWIYIYSKYALINRLQTTMPCQILHNALKIKNVNTMKSLNQHLNKVTRFNIMGSRQNGRHFPDDIFKCIFSMKMYDFRLKCHLILLLGVKLIISQHWLR